MSRAQTNALTMKEKFREKIKQKIEKKLADAPSPSTLPDLKINQINKPGDYTLSLKQDDIERFYKIHVPKNYKSENPTPLVLAFHGGLGDMEIQSTEKYYHQISKSESEGYIALFPNGYSKFKSGKLATWNAETCCGEARDKKINDIEFIKKIIEKTKSELNIDSHKIFATGISNGGMISYRIACELADIFKAIAAVASTDNVIDCNPKNPISILHIHANNDDHILFNGGMGPKAINKAAETEFISVPKTIAKWVRINECPKIPKRILNIEGAYCDLYSPCKNHTEVKLCVTEKGGHSWPGGEKPRSNSGESPSSVISATDLIWDFFKEK